MKSAPSISTERSKTQNLSSKNAFARASAIEPFCAAFSHAGVSVMSVPNARLGWRIFNHAFRY